MKPTPGKQYTIQNEDTLSQVAQQAYGNSNHWPRIWRANQSALRSGDPNLIFPGEVIFIPQLAELSQDPASIQNREPDELTIVADGLELMTTGAQIVLTMDTTSDGWTATMPWEPFANPELDKRVIFHADPPTNVYVGGKLVISGKMSLSESEVGENATIKNLGGFSRTADMLDSTLPPPLEENNVTLLQRAQKLAQAHGIKVVAQTDMGGPFDRVKIGESEKIGQHLKKLSGVRAILMSNTPAGDLLFYLADTSAPPVATLEESKLPVLHGYSVAANARKRFATYRALSTTPLDNHEGIVADTSVGGARHTTFRVDGLTAGEIETAARWARNLAWLEALTIPLPVEGWLNPAGDLWLPGMIVTYVSPSNHLSKGFDFIIRRIAFKETDTGKSAILSLIPPQIYSKEEVVEPWS